jgi:ABC-2 type transport system ATP-binding protein
MRTTGSAPDGAVLECARLAKRFGDVQAVAEVGFTIAPGETYGLLGPNGAGKTTTISMVCGLLEPDAGEVTVAGRAMSTTATAAKAVLGFVPQELAIYPDLTARENLRFFGRLQGLRGSDLARRIDEILEIIGLTDRADDRTDDFSGGMKRRLNIGIGLLHEPRLLLLDEPTVGVDPQSRNSILQSVEDLGRAGLAVLYTTHYMEEAERLCDRVGIIDRGQLQAEGTRRELVELVGSQDRVNLTMHGGTDEAVVDRLEALDDVASASAVEDRVEVLVRNARGHLPALLEEVSAAGNGVTSVEIVEPDLEAVFLHLTGRALRD